MWKALNFSLHMCIRTKVHKTLILWTIIWKILHELGFHGPHMYMQKISVGLLKNVPDSMRINHL